MRKNQAWVEEEEQYLIDNYPEVPITEMAEKLGRTYSSVSGKISNMKERGQINKRIGFKQRIDWETHIPTILELYGKVTQKEIAERTGIHPRMISVKIEELAQEGKIKRERKRRRSHRSNRIADIEVARERIEEIRAREREEECRVINQIVEIDKELIIGRRYKISATNLRHKGYLRDFTGTLKIKHKDFYLFEGPYRQSFLKKDFATGEYKIKAVG